jgi:succinate dehydrogenase hydrophobic anchor subunit
VTATAERPGGARRADANLEHAASSAAALRRGLYSYLLVRLTGLVLAVLVIGHLIVTHVVTDVAGTDAGFIAKRWGSALWLAWDWLMLAAALAHAGAGVWVAIDDYSRPAARRRRMHQFLLGVLLVLFALGTFGIAKAIYT